MTDESDKRKHFRPMAYLEIKVLPGGSAEIPSDLKLETIDVAVGGLRCASNVFLETGTDLRVTLELIGGELREPETIVGDVRVLRCTWRPDQPTTRRYEVALSFVQLSSQEKKRLQRYLSSL